jgi:carboxyl-terminal processing protease
MIDLNRAVPIANKKIGQLKLTIAKFYRITGNTTQKVGVKPDIEYPSAFDNEELGERAKPSALPFDKINSTKFEKVSDIGSLISKLKTNHELRLKNDPEAQLFLDEIAEFNDNQEKKTFSLNIEARREQRRIAEEKKKQREEQRAKITGLKIEEKKEVESVKKEEPDFELKESGRILVDYILAKVG